MGNKTDRDNRRAIKAEKAESKVMNDLALTRFENERIQGEKNFKRMTSAITKHGVSRPSSSDVNERLIEKAVEVSGGGIILHDMGDMSIPMYAVQGQKVKVYPTEQDFRNELRETLKQGTPKMKNLGELAKSQGIARTPQEYKELARQREENRNCTNPIPKNKRSF